MKEQQIQNAIRMAIAEYGTYFRANVGTAWRGREYIKKGRNLTIIDAVPLSTGLPKGFSDLFGATPVLITPDMVGKTLPIFTVMEVKTATGRLRKEQAHFLEFMGSINAISGVVRSVDDALTLINLNKGIDHAGSN